MATQLDQCAGGIVLGDAGAVALVWSKNSQTWLFPKGKIEPGEDDEAAARREVAEETGLTTLEYLDDLGGFIRKGQDGRTDKHIRMFLFSTTPGAALLPTKEIEKAEWFPLSRIAEVLGNGEHVDRFAADKAWFASVFPRIRQAVQRD